MSSSRSPTSVSNDISASHSITQHTPSSAPTDVMTPPTPAAAVSPPIASTTTQSRSTSNTMTSPSPDRRPSASSSFTEACEACLTDRLYVARIRSPAHVWLAVRLLFTDPSRRRDLFTNWIHVPLGITSLLFLTWLIKQAMDRAPFRFPSPVLAMLLLFVILLLLDYLSTTSAVRRWQMRRGGEEKESKMLLQPMLTLLEAPCDFCLRYMSVMFTPSFILIPAREIISGREIGLITGWFTVSQLAGLIFPVLLHKAIRWVVETSRKRFDQRRGRREEKVRKAEEQRRASVATLVAVMSNINAVPLTSSEGPEKVVEGAKLGSIATGLSGMTAIATAPLQLNTPRAPLLRGPTLNLSSDAQRHLNHVALETARQQGDPHATPTQRDQHYPSTPASPRPGSAHRCNSGYFARGRHPIQQEARGSRSATLSPRRRPRSGNDANKGRFGAVVVGPGSGLRREMRRPQSANDTRHVASTPVEKESTPTFDEYIFRARRDLMARRESAGDGVDPRTTIQEVGSGPETLVMPTLAPPTPTRGSVEVDGGRPSKSDSDTTIGDAILPHPTTSSDDSKEKAKLADQQLTTTVSIPPASLAEDTPETDAIDRLVNTLWTSLPWLVTLITLAIGLPVFYLVSISLPLFLAINILTFLVAITLVPPVIRRYAHPILTTSLLTVFILWGLGAARGWSLRQTLASYSVDAKYTVLWSLSGYTGPVIGAGDVLFSTLDAGIVSLAIPMYRYRRDLWNHLSDMLVVLLPCALLSVFVWPTIAAAMGIAPERALAFASRFMSTPLAIELSLTIGADESITVVLVVITGILISIFKDPFFRFFRLNPENDGDEEGDRDYLTIGIAMGSTAGAIGASSLISKPRCMAIASLSFVLFGAILLVLAAIPPVVDTMRGLAGASAEFVPAL